jgi:hypothetical protein
VPEIKIKMTLNGQEVDAADIPIMESNENWSHYKLEDGTTLRVKFAVGSIIRLTGQFDPENNPIYAVRGTVVSVPIVPDEKRKKD